jgi:hypothetical protein
MICAAHTLGEQRQAPQRRHTGSRAVVGGWQLVRQGTATLRPAGDNFPRLEIPRNGPGACAEFQLTVRGPRILELVELTSANCLFVIRTFDI